MGQTNCLWHLQIPFIAFMIEYIRFGIQILFEYPKIFCYKSCLQNLRNIFILINILLPTIKATFFISHQNYFWLCFKICISIARWHLVHKINCLFILEKKEHTRISKYDVVQLIIHCWKKKFRHGDMRSYIKIFRSSICFIFGTYVCFR